MSDSNDRQTQVCNAGLPENIEAYASPDIRPGKTDETSQDDSIVVTASKLDTATASEPFDASWGVAKPASLDASWGVAEPAPLDASWGVAKRRASFAAPENADAKKKNTGGLDGLGGGRLP